MLLRSLELSVEISETVSLPLSLLHCCSASPRIKTGVHLNTSPPPVGIVWVAVARRWVTLLPTAFVDDLAAVSMMTISGNTVPENFLANESMFFLKVSLRSGLRPNLMGWGDGLDVEYKFSVCEETARGLVGFAQDSVAGLWHTPVVDERCCCLSPSLLFGVDDVFDAIWLLAIGKDNGEELSPWERVVVESAAGLSSDVEHMVEDSGADGCSNMLNQGCWRHSVTVRRSLRNKNRLKYLKRGMFSIFWKI